MILPKLGYENIRISPFKIQELKELQVIRKINQHSKLKFTGIISSEQKDSDIEAADINTQVEVTLSEPEGITTTFFKGPVTKVQVKTIHDVYFIEVEAFSHTYHLDIEIKSRSFQNGAMTYTDMIKTVIADYPGSDMIDTASQGATLKTFAIQYRQTDWQYLKQKASLFHTGIFPADTFDSPKFYFGVPEGDCKGDLDNFNYIVRKNIAGFRTASENYDPSLQESDFICYEVVTGQVLNLGDQINFKGKPLYVFEAVSAMDEGRLKHRYLLTPKGGLSRNPIYNPALIGASIRGKVIDVAKDMVRVHLEIDENQNKDEAYWFQYATMYTAEGNSGWYCMPELGDTVRIYFPSSKEEDAVAQSSVRTYSQEGDKLDNPDVKYFRTKFGKELMFSPEEIVITGKDGELFIKLNEKDGIVIFSKEAIKFITQDNLRVDSKKKVIISAKEKINISCKGSSIQMDGKTSIKGQEIKSN